MTRIVVRDTPADGRAELASAEHLDEELRELVRPPREPPGILSELAVRQEARVLVPEHPRARARRHDDVVGVAKERHGARGDRPGLGVVAGVEKRQPTARLTLR